MLYSSLRGIFSLNNSGWGKSSSSPDPKDPTLQTEKKKPSSSSSSESPPDLDELWNSFTKRLGTWFGWNNNNPNQQPSTPPPPMHSFVILGITTAILLLIWLSTGFYIVQEGEEALVLRFGRYEKLVNRAGFTWHIPYPIERAEIINVQQLRTVEVGYRSSVKNKTLKESLVLTKDQSIVDMQFTVQYRISNAQDYLFNNDLGGSTQAQEIVRQAAESAMREVVGATGIDQVLYEEKEHVARTVRKRIRDLLDVYQAGIDIVDVTIQQVQPPEQVQSAFEDANKAAQDRERLINEGRAYANDVTPRAHGAAARVVEEALGYRQRIISTAEGDTERFRRILVEYLKAPQVTRNRLYIEKMENFYSKSPKIFLESGQNPNSASNIYYLPLTHLMQQPKELYSQPSENPLGSVAKSSEDNSPSSNKPDQRPPSDAGNLSSEQLPATKELRMDSFKNRNRYIRN